MNTTSALVGLPPAPGPIEASGRRRDQARLLVVSPSSVVDATFAALGEFLSPGDVLVVNTSATLPAALPVEGPAFGRNGHEGLLLHLGTELPGGLRLVELRTATGFGSEPFGDSRPGALRLPGGGRAELLSPWPPTPAEGPSRLWVARLDVPGDQLAWLADHGRPIRYGEPAEPWPITAYQTVFANEPGQCRDAVGRPGFHRRAGDQPRVGWRDRRSPAAALRRVVTRGGRSAPA